MGQVPVAEAGVDNLLISDVVSLTPMWPRLKAIAHTLPYDNAITANCQKGEPLAAQRWSSVMTPSLLLVGGKSPDWIKNGMLALADALPHAEQLVLDRQTHMVKPKATAPALLEFFAAEERIGAPRRGVARAAA